MKGTSSAVVAILLATITIATASVYFYTKRVPEITVTPELTTSTTPTTSALGETTTLLSITATTTLTSSISIITTMITTTTPITTTTTTSTSTTIKTTATTVETTKTTLSSTCSPGLLLYRLKEGINPGMVKSDYEWYYFTVQQSQSVTLVIRDTSGGEYEICGVLNATSYYECPAINNPRTTCAEEGVELKYSDLKVSTNIILVHRKNGPAGYEIQYNVLSSSGYNIEKL